MTAVFTEEEEERKMHFLLYFLSSLETTCILAGGGEGERGKMGVRKRRKDSFLQVSLDA